MLSSFVYENDVPNDVRPAIKFIKVARVISLVYEKEVKMVTR
jgi:hypothetical protein